MVNGSANVAAAPGDRDATLRLIKWFSIEQVRKAKVLVVGAGAIGNEALKNLALLGVGNVYIIDKDTIELSNLTRSVLYRESDCGQPKAQVAARALQNINPVVKARWKQGDLRFDLGRGLLRHVDVVIAGLDNVPARHELNTLCFTAGRPWIDAGIDVLDGHVCVYSPHEGACYECYFTEEQHREIQRSCAVIASRYEQEGKLATTPTIASIVGGVQVQEALKLLDPGTWHDRTLVSRKFMFNGSTGDCMTVKLVRRPDCTRPHFTIDPDSVVELAGASARATTARELLDMTEELCRAPVSIGLNFELAVALQPHACGDTHLILQPVEKLSREDLRCEKCGWEPERRTALVRKQVIDRALVEQYPEAVGGARLIDLGIPPLEIMRVYRGEPLGAKPKGSRKGKAAAAAASAGDGGPMFIELTGDLGPDLGFNEL
jgi:adenylyltransferase/sulfurtransferase